jgi:hypothetical protein
LTGAGAQTASIFRFDLTGLEDQQVERACAKSCHAKRRHDRRRVAGPPRNIQIGMKLFF